MDRESFDYIMAEIKKELEEDEREVDELLKEEYDKKEYIGTPEMQADARATDEADKAEKKRLEMARRKQWRLGQHFQDESFEDVKKRLDAEALNIQEQQEEEKRQAQELQDEQTEEIREQEKDPDIDVEEERKAEEIQEQQTEDIPEPEVSSNDEKTLKPDNQENNINRDSRLSVSSDAKEEMNYSENRTAHEESLLSALREEYNERSEGQEKGIDGEGHGESQ